MHVILLLIHHLVDYNAFSNLFNVLIYQKTDSHTRIPRCLCHQLFAFLLYSYFII